MNTQPNALRLAHALSGGKLIDDSTEWADTLHAAAAELRSQHARIEELEAQLSAIGAGGVEPLRKQAEGVLAQTDHATELAPPNSLPTFDECALRVENSNFLEKRAAGGGYGPEHDSRTATQLHRFVYEYDDADPVRSSWFLHRLELLLNEVRSASQPAAQGMDAETQRHAAIGKAIERACADLPDGTEISVSLEKDAGTVTLIDQDGNEYENFSCDYGFAGVLNEAIDAAMAAHARNKKGIEQ